MLYMLKTSKACQKSKILQVGVPAIEGKALFAFNYDQNLFQMHMLNYKITSSLDS